MTENVRRDEDDAQLRTTLANRHAVLESLDGAGKTRPTLVDELDVSRSTLDRALDALVSAGCAESDGRRYRVTVLGATALAEYRDYRETIDRLQSAEPVLNALPSDESVDREILRGADIHLSSSRAPDTSLTPAIELLDEATALRGTAPVVFREYFDVLGARLRDGGFDLELVLERELLETIETEYGEEFEALSGFDDVNVYVSDERIPYSLWLIEGGSTTHTGVTVYEDGAIKGSIVNDASAAVAAATRRYERMRDGAKKLR